MISIPTDESKYNKGKITQSKLTLICVRCVGHGHRKYIDCINYLIYLIFYLFNMMRSINQSKNYFMVRKAIALGLLINH